MEEYAWSLGMDELRPHFLSTFLAILGQTALRTEQTVYFKKFNSNHKI
jgi:hypothetical protein